MFTRPPFHVPYNLYSPSPPPAGIRIADYMSPRRCFNPFKGPNFTTARSPAPTPDSSPVKSKIDPYDDAPPTIPLAQMFAGDRLGSPQRPGSESPQRSSTPTPMRPPNRGNFSPADPPKPKPNPQPRFTFHKTKHGPKRAVSHINRRSSLLSDQEAPEKRIRRKKVKVHERRAARAHRKLQSFLQQAEAAIGAGYTGLADKVFLDQLEKLRDDQKRQHDLDQCRQRMARANAESPQRMKEHEGRNELADKMWEDCDEEEDQKEQERKVAEFLQELQEKKAERRRQAEENGLRADEERQRAHNEQERKMREEQDRLLREALDRKKEEEERSKREEQERQEMEHKTREERARQLREEQARKFRERVELLTRKDREGRQESERLRRERLAREAQERILGEQQERLAREQQERLAREHQERIAREQQERLAREQQERLAREQQERLAREQQERLAREQQERFAREQQERERQARRAALEDQVRERFVVYEAKWQELRNNKDLPLIDVHEMPWPVLGVVSSAEQITYQDVREFLFHPLRPDVQNKSGRDKVKSEVLRFHPDKFNARVVPRIQEAQQAVAKEIAGTIARILTRIMTEEE